MLVYIDYITFNSVEDCCISRAQTLRAEYINLHILRRRHSVDLSLPPPEAALPFEKCMRRTLFHLSSLLHFEFILHF